MKRLLSPSATAAVAAGAVSTVVFGASPATAAPAATATPGAYAGITPSRALDTRTNGGALGQGATRKVGLATLVPSTTATAVVLNLTVTAPTAAGYLTVFPDGVTRPTASSINKRAGETRSNSVTVALPASGSRVLDVYNQAGSSQVVVDVLGYYDPAQVGTGAAYTALDTPVRPVDTRPTRLPAGVGVDVSTESSFTASHQVAAVAVNITATDVTGPGFLTAWSGLGPQPGISTVNYGTDSATPNFAVVPVVQGSDGLVQFHVQNNVSLGAAVIVDILGFYTTGDTSGSLYLPVSPTRIADTRLTDDPLLASVARTFTTPTGPAAVDAVNLNATAVDATGPTYVSVYPADAGLSGSTLNPTTVDALANAVQTGVAAASESSQTYQYDVFNAQGTVDFIADLQGWFVRAEA